MKRRFLYQPRGRANETHAFIADREDGLYAINHAYGCSHGCMYPCYAQMRQETLRGHTYEAWLNAKIHTEAPDVIRIELDRMKGRPVQDVELCFTTDPFMYGNEAMVRTSNNIIHVLTNRGIGVTVLTKGSLFDATSGGSAVLVKYGISLVSLKDGFCKQWEPGAALPKRRVEALKQKHEEGFRTWVSIEPFPPPAHKTNDVAEVLRRLDFVNKAILGRWNYAGWQGEIADRYYARVALDFERTCLEMGIECKVKLDITGGKSHA